ncbi:MAG TPA: ubiquinol-cytochrome c reductase iron-sulfur subunit [Acidobacteriaceae bacterium]|nr:ubiquinol-cytochrome c reductase iron-sulfur subunit [Acidobacteriaceae bacterium]
MSDKPVDPGDARAAEETGAKKEPSLTRDLARLGASLWHFAGAMVSIGADLLETARNVEQKVDALTSPLPADEPGIDGPIAPPAETDRDSDRDLGPASAPARLRRLRWGTAFAFSAFAAAIVAGIGFICFYWTRGTNEQLGVTLAIALGGTGCALVFYARWLIRPTEAIEPRPELSSAEEERAAIAHTYRSAAEDTHRRTLLQWMGAMTVGVLAAGVVSLLRSLGSNPDQTLYSRVWKHGERLMTIDSNPLTIHSLDTGGTAIVFPESSVGSEKTQTVLIRVNPDLLQLPSARSDWAPLGYLAYSRVCTHAGCAVGMYEAEQNLLLCPCHQSTFDVLRGAVPTSGPAARPLPQLPLYADSDGTLRAGGGFSEPTGPGFWGIDD